MNQDEILFGPSMFPYEDVARSWPLRHASGVEVMQQFHTLYSNAEEHPWPNVNWTEAQRFRQSLQLPEFDANMLRSGYYPKPKTRKATAIRLVTWQRSEPTEDERSYVPAPGDIVRLVRTVSGFSHDDCDGVLSGGRVYGSSNKTNLGKVFRVYSYEAGDHCVNMQGVSEANGLVIDGSVENVVPECLVLVSKSLYGESSVNGSRVRFSKAYREVLGKEAPESGIGTVTSVEGERATVTWDVNPVRSLAQSDIALTLLESVPAYEDPAAVLAPPYSPVVGDKVVTRQPNHSRSSTPSNNLGEVVHVHRNGTVDIRYVGTNSHVRNLPSNSLRLHSRLNEVVEAKFLYTEVMVTTFGGVVVLGNSLTPPEVVVGNDLGRPSLERIRQSLTRYGGDVRSRYMWSYANQIERLSYFFGTPKFTILNDHDSPGGVAQTIVYCCLKTPLDEPVSIDYWKIANNFYVLE